MKVSRTWMAVLAAGAALLMAMPDIYAGVRNAATNPASNAFGQGFDEWLRDYWAWNYGGVGPQVQPNKVFFLPVPVPADDAWQIVNGRNIGTAEMDVTMQPGMKLVLGILAWIGEKYQDGHEDPMDQFTIANFLPPRGQAIIKLDGVELINDANVASFYYDPIRFKEPLVYATPTDYGSVAAVWVQGIGIVLQPLTPGKHTLTLYSWDDWQGLYGEHGIGWFNTWHITVKPPGKK